MRRARSPASMARFSSARLTFPSTVRQGRSDFPYCWKRTTSSRGGPVTRRPATRMSPAVARRSPPTICRRVVFPQPDGPTRQRSSPSSTAKLMSSRTRSGAPRGVGNVAPTARTSRTAVTGTLELHEEVFRLQRGALVEQSPFLRHVHPELHRVDERRAPQLGEVHLPREGGIEIRVLHDVVARRLVVLRDEVHALRVRAVERLSDVAILVDPILGRDEARDRDVVTDLAEVVGEDLPVL